MTQTEPRIRRTRSQGRLAPDVPSAEISIVPSSAWSASAPRSRRMSSIVDTSASRGAPVIGASPR